ncbi:MAG TPA: YggS family pyridoxal phosphate-dependent enzyme [Pyrinomonadaceae bacterium]|jgi:pyridoxal phosphate enzyme (YggS family)|nr:YggS family pyridoxal phosphate-dependent enzyme [Pyrinomonadaceae bacterium]
MMSQTEIGPEGLAERLALVRQRIATSAKRCGHAPEDLTLIAVSKTHPPEILQRAIAAGVSDLGENRVQEADAKITLVGRERARWHLIGHLQANKARRAVALFDVIHSLDSASLARRLDHLCAEASRAALPVLIQVDLAGEETKSGVDEDELPRMVEAVAACERLRLSGLMTLPPFFEDAALARPYFRRLRELRDALASKGIFGPGRGELSMGMSHDFEVAIEEGATMVRVGTAIFGARPAVG